MSMIFCFIGFLLITLLLLWFFYLKIYRASLPHLGVRGQEGEREKSDLVAFSSSFHSPSGKFDYSWYIAAVASYNLGANC